MADFIANAGYPAYIRTVTAMRRDLWNKKTAIDEAALSRATQGFHSISTAHAAKRFGGYVRNISVPLLQILVSAFVALLVVALGHAFTLWRDRQNRRQEQRIDYLVSVYRAFNKANHHPKLYEVAEELEQAVVDVQLFGTPHQVALVRRFATDLGAAQTAEMDELLVELRDSLRAELGAAPLDSRHLGLRVGRKKEDDEVEPKT